MLDLLYLLMIVAFFAIALTYTRARDRGSIVQKLLRLAGDGDVHVVAERDQREP